MNRELKSWLEILKTMPDSTLALFLLHDLVGYRDTSKYRPSDKDSVLNLIEAIRIDERCKCRAHPKRLELS
jgi:hypothetical protein